MNRFLRSLLAALVCLVTTPAPAQTSYFNQGFLRQPSAQADRDYLGISGGAGTVTSFSSGNLSPLFTTSVATPATTPALTFTLSPQTANTVFAGPSAAGPSAPTFRGLVTTDLPDISTIVRGDVSATPPVLYDSATGIFSMHVADSTHNGYLSSADWTTFNNKGSGTVTSIANAGIPSANSTLVASASAPIPTIKSVSSAGSISVVDVGGTNLLFTGSTTAAGVDIAMNFLGAYANNTNFYVDLNYGATTLQTSNDIAFNYSTNYGLSSTSRVCSVYIPATNFVRHVYFLNAATNWHLLSPIVNIPAMRGAKFEMQVFGVGETNVTLRPSIDVANAGSLAQVYNLTNITSSTNLLMVDATKSVYQDAFQLIPAADGDEIRAWADLSGKGNHLTNNTAANNTIYLRNTYLAPFNLPCVEELPGSANVWLKSPTISTLTSPVYVFYMFYSTKGGNNQTIDSLSGINTRLLCDAVFGGNCTIATQNASSFTAANNGTPKWTLFTFVFNGASSSIRTNAVAAATSTLATTAGNGITFGSDINGTLPTGLTYLSEIQVWWGTLSATDLGNIETNYFRAKYRNW